MIIPVETLLAMYFSYKRDVDPAYDHLLDSYYSYKSNGGPNTVISHEYGIQATVGHYWRYPDGKYELVDYCADREIMRYSTKKCGSPLQVVSDCNYMYYGTKLCITAFLLKVDPQNVTLTLYNLPNDHDKITFKYRPEIAEVLLYNRKKSLIALKQENFNPKQKILF